MFSLVDLTFLARQERKSGNCKSSETIKVIKMQFIVCVVNCVIVQRNFVLSDKSSKEILRQAVQIGNE